jgi:putative spermidine/putrescine transport system substrate-binding protein
MVGKTGKAVGPTVGRRRILGHMAGAGAALCAPAVLTRSARAAERLIVAQPGGPYETGFRAAFAEPFTKATGVEIALVTRPFFPSGQVQSQVETRSYQWDVVSLSAFDVEILTRKGMLEELDFSGVDLSRLMPQARRSNWLGVDVYATVLGYRTDKHKEHPPANWADLWAFDKIQGKRSLYKSPIGTLEQALLADGVPPDHVYPIDYARAFKKLDQIKSKISVWWASGAQSTQILRDGDVDIMAIWNGRAQAAIEDGTPAQMVWQNGLYTVHGFSLAKGVPKKQLGLEFIKFCASGERQAAYTKHLAGGPTNLSAYDFIEPKVAALLPTQPKNLALLFEQNTAWWTDHKEEAVDKFNEWLIG